MRQRSSGSSLQVSRRPGRGNRVLGREKLGTGRDVRLGLLGEIALSAWRCAARNWIRSLRNGTTQPAGTAGLVREINGSFDAVPASLTLTVR